MVDTAERVAPSDPGITPVPAERRSLGAWDVAILWGDLGIGLLVLVTGALLVPALGFGTAFTIIVVGSAAGVALLALVAAAGADHGVATMVLFRPVLGIRGSWVASLLNIVQLIGWVAVELWAMSFVADLVAQRVFGFSARGWWLAIVAIVCTGMALWGPVGVTKVWLQRFGAWVTLAICVIVTGLVVTSDPGPSQHLVASTFPNVGQALDLVIAMPISWLPLVADYTRFASGRRSAFGGTFTGYLLANVWLYALGALIVLNSPAPVVASPEGIAVGILALAGGSLAGILFLAGLLAGETDEAFANLYSTAVSVQNIFPRLSQKAVIIVIAVVGTALAGALNMVAYESFLFFIGSVFVPLFGIFVADHFVLRKGAVDTGALYEGRGRYWFTGGFRISALIPWLIGFFVFHWINPSPLEWWVELFTGWFGDPISTKISWLPGSLPAFVASFAATIIARRISPKDREDTK